MEGYVGTAMLRSLTAASSYDYKCHLWFGIGPYESTPLESVLGTLGTDPALTEIGASLSGTNATLTIDLANKDGIGKEVHLRHREFPMDAWTESPAVTTNTDSAQFTFSSLTDDTVHEFQASLAQNFPEIETLTLYLVVGNPPYVTSPTSGSSTPIEDPNSGNTPPGDGNNGDLNGGNDGNGGNGGNGGGGGGGGFGGFGGGGSSVTRNTPPNFRDSARDMRTVPENSEEGVTVGKPIMAWDPENDVLEFSLPGDAAEPFTIDEKTGQILVGPEAVLDYEAQNVHVVTLVVTDTDGDTAITELEIHLTDVKLPGKADAFDVANNHNERLEQEEVEAAATAYGLGLITKLETLFIVKYYYSTEMAAIDFANLPSMVDKYDLNEDSIIDRGEVLMALQDFMEGKLSRSDMRQIVEVYYTTVEETA